VNICAMALGMSLLGDVPMTTVDYTDTVNWWARDYSAKYEVNIDPEVIEAIIRVESSGNPWAVRHEPRFLVWLKTRIKSLNSVATQTTEYQLRSTSFGLGQIMGQTARELGFNEPYLTQLCDPDINIRYTCKYFGKLLRRYRGEEHWAISAYNAGSARKNSMGKFVNQQYVNKVLKELEGA